ncbi:hypothetical protein FYC62_06235 [Pedobacter aquae]|uniref:Uncharacterized protein n=1 Tax=Pedobacter aquae TaxID=2605747 RepID=A0A5C0VF16_9SPHI|nr:MULTISPECIES: hypothetical protein [Pedobacter]QEK51308.1 hypothetical protein FYC62_06235 [Pedobacter aquae]
MKTMITEAAKDMIRKFDQELFSILREDVKKFRQSHQDNMINFNTKRFDMELKQILAAELEQFRKQSATPLVKVG